MKQEISSSFSRQMLPLTIHLPLFCSENSSSLCFITGQTEEIDVGYELGERTAPAGISEITWSAILVCVVVLILTVIVFMRLLDKPAGSRPFRQGPPAASSVVVAPVTPDRTSAANIRSSPHTPQRFMEYVRRTIDETPYYNREGRRRFDPQYTY